MSDAILRVEGLVKRYRTITAVDHLQLEVRPGELVGFIGPNGAGKTTTMRCIAGQLVPDGGEVWVGGVAVTQDPVGVKGKIGYVPQELELYAYLTGEEFLRFVGDLRGVPREAQEERMKHLLDLCELSHARDRLVREYSGGMARKLAICAALLAEPPLLLLDESFVGLDPESTHAIQGLLRDYCARGHAILLSSHILDMLERLCTRVVLVAAGKVQRDLQRDALEALFQSGEHPTLTDLYLKTTAPFRRTPSAP